LYRQALALYEQPHIEGNDELCLLSIQAGLEIDPQNEEL
jgi:hypothetical protein